MRALVALLVSLAIPFPELAARPVNIDGLAVPVETVSPELAEIMAKPAPAAPAPESVEAWEKLQAASDGQRGTDATTLAKSLGCRIEEKTVAGVRCYLVTPKEVPASHQDRLLVHLHGGAYILGSGVGATMEAILVAASTGTPVLSVDYRMPPEHPFPAALDDAVVVWKELLKDRKPSQLALLGTSAGGGLTMATVHKLKELDVPLPAALMLGTPASDLTKTGDTYSTNAGTDNMLGRYEGFLEESFKLYAGDNNMKDPLISPIYGDFTGFPPTILISGTRDLFLSNTVRAHRKMRAARVPAELHVYEGQSHADYLRAPQAPESKDAFREVAGFFDRHLAPDATKP
jgi:monoterpene epsilon-lactone hydrolase